MFFKRNYVHLFSFIYVCFFFHSFNVCFPKKKTDEFDGTEIEERIPSMRFGDGNILQVQKNEQT